MTDAFKTLDEVIRAHVQAALIIAQNNRTEAAKLLGISRWALARMLKKWAAGEKAVS